MLSLDAGELCVTTSYLEPISNPSSVAFTPDGRRALVTRNGDNGIGMLTINDA